MFNWVVVIKIVGQILALVLQLLKEVKVQSFKAGAPKFGMQANGNEDEKMQKALARVNEQVGEVQEALNELADA